MAGHHYEPQVWRGRKGVCLATALMVLLGVGSLQGPLQAQAASRKDPFIAGVHPDRRPEGAPVLKTFPKDAAWYDRALHGISEPYPYSLKFLEDQGAWYTPFIRPGMLPPYDIRGWHRRAATASRKAAVKAGRTRAGKTRKTRGKKTRGRKSRRK